MVAYSPGFFVQSTSRGKPEPLISPGKQDGVLPIDTTSRRLVPSLGKQGYVVNYREFGVVHGVPKESSEQAMAWLESKDR